MGGNFEEARLGKNEFVLSVLEQEEHHSKSFGENMEKFGENMEKFGQIIDIFGNYRKFRILLGYYHRFSQFSGVFRGIRKN